MYFFKNQLHKHKNFGPPFTKQIIAAFPQSKSGLLLLSKNNIDGRNNGIDPGTQFFSKIFLERESRF